MANNIYDCIVIGGGHAGIEACYATAKMGAKTLLLTISIDSIGAMSCNPAIGGLGKGQIVREVDAMGGIMALAIDATGIQFRLLNQSKGPAVQSPRAQADKYEYKTFIQNYLRDVDNLTIEEGIASEILTEDNTVTGVKTLDGQQYNSKRIIVTAGTFLRGLMHIGQEITPGGRIGEPPSNELSDSLKKLGLPLGRLKTGTPVRIDAKTIDYSKTERQDGDENPVPFSFINDKITQEQIPCWITYTNEETHKMLYENLHRAPMYTGQIESTGPRYCPSIETKIERFPDKDKHQIFLEPEDRAQTTMYPNGISTSYPKDIQEAMLRLIPGTENAKIIHYAYAIEYDFIPATELRTSLETRHIHGLFMAGQVNGTSGYEEAAAQGLIAGINAVKSIRNEEPVIIGRDQAYIGVLIDDILTKELDEPYRMFTSRAEYRLTLRSDNADRRLTPLARELGLINENRWDIYQAKIKGINKLTEYLKHKKIQGKSLFQQLSQPQNPLSQTLYDDPNVIKMQLSREIIEAVIIDAKYQGYLKKQDKMIRNFRNMENIKVPDEIDYTTIPHLRAEAKDRLSAFRPYNLGQAGRIGGITPSDLTVIQIYLKKLNHKDKNKGHL